MSSIYHYALEGFLKENPELFMARLELLCQNEGRAYKIFEPFLKSVTIVDEGLFRAQFQTYLSKVCQGRVLTEITETMFKDGSLKVCYKYKNNEGNEDTDIQWIGVDKCGDAIKCEFV